MVHHRWHAGRVLGRDGHGVAVTALREQLSERLDQEQLSRSADFER